VAKDSSCRWLFVVVITPLLFDVDSNSLLHWGLSLAAQCIVIGPVCGRVCNGPAGSVCVCYTTITRNCVHRTSPNLVWGKGSDRLQLIKFWPSCAAGNGVCGGAKISGSALLQPARSVCVYLSAFFMLPSTNCIFGLKPNTAFWRPATGKTDTDINASESVLCRRHL